MKHEIDRCFLFLPCLFAAGFTLWATVHLRAATQPIAVCTVEPGGSLTSDTPYTGMCNQYNTYTLTRNVACDDGGVGKWTETANCLFQLTETHRSSFQVFVQAPGRSYYYVDSPNARWQLGHGKDDAEWLKTNAQWAIGAGIVALILSVALPMKLCQPTDDVDDMTTLTAATKVPAMTKCKTCVRYTHWMLVFVFLVTSYSISASVSNTTFEPFTLTA